MMSTGMTKIMVRFTAAALISAVAASSAAASGRYAGYVTADSHFGHGRVSGPVRNTRLGPQVRLPGGTWVYCRQACSETLRVETVDFFEYRKGDTHDTYLFGRPLELRFGYGR